MRIGIAGPAGAGKDTVASYLSEALRMDVVHFADPIREASVFVFGNDNRETKEQRQFVSAEAVYQASIKCCRDAGIDSFPEVLKAMTASHVVFDRYLSDPLHMIISPRRFCQLLGTEIVRSIKDSAFVDRVAGIDWCLVPDVRFPNEAKIMGVNLFIDRDVPSVADHPSEQMAKEMQAACRKFHVGEDTFSGFQHFGYGGVSWLYVPNFNGVADLHTELDQLVKELKGE